MLTWDKIREWSGGLENRIRYHPKFWRWFEEKYGAMPRQKLVDEAGSLMAKAHTEHDLGWGTLACSCHMRQVPNAYFPKGFTLQGDPAAAAWHHLPRVHAYLIRLLLENFALATECLMGHALARGGGGYYTGFIEAFELARGIGDWDRARVFAWLIVDYVPQQVYFFTRREISDAELLMRARIALVKNCSSHQARWCADANSDPVLGEMVSERDALLTR